jgi:hypothetical protein
MGRGRGPKLEALASQKDENTKVTKSEGMALCSSLRYDWLLELAL